MSLTLEPIPLPLRQDDTGILRVGGTRVTLDTIVSCHKRGDSPVQISDAYPVRLADVYAVISYYLSHTDAVEAYLRDREVVAEHIRQSSPLREAVDVKQRLIARRDAKS